MPVGVEDRDADVWEALFAVADAAGGSWQRRARDAALTLITSSKAAQPTSLGVLLLRDLRAVFVSHERLSSDAILNGLVSLPESQWADLRGKELDARGLAQRLRKYDVKPAVITPTNGKSYRGYEASDLADAWTRYLPPPHEPNEDDPPGAGRGCVIGVSDVTKASDETDITQITHSTEAIWAVCVYRLDPVLVTAGHTTHPNCEPKPCGHPGKPLPSGKCGDCIAEAGNAKRGAA